MIQLQHPVKWKKRVRIRSKYQDWKQVSLQVELFIGFVGITAVDGTARPRKAKRQYLLTLLCGAELWGKNLCIYIQPSQVMSVDDPLS